MFSLSVRIKQEILLRVESKRRIGRERESTSSSSSRCRDRREFHEKGSKRTHRFMAKVRGKGEVEREGRKRCRRSAEGGRARGTSPAASNRKGRTHGEHVERTGFRGYRGYMSPAKTTTNGDRSGSAKQFHEKEEIFLVKKYQSPEYVGNGRDITFRRMTFAPEEIVKAVRP